MGECPWCACVRRDKRVIFFFFQIRIVHIAEIRRILENLRFIFLLAPATSGCVVMLCLVAYGLQGRKKKFYACVRYLNSKKKTNR